MIHLDVLGQVRLSDGAGRELRPVLAQPKRLALLAYLAVAGKEGQRRDALLALFWPELDEAHARDALSQALRFLRSHCGPAAIRSRGSEDVVLDRSALRCDAVAFCDAAAAGRNGDALELYRGDLLESFHLSGSNAYEEWLSAERSRLRGIAARCARKLAAEREKGENFTTAVTCARRAVELADLDERAMRELIALLDRLGDRAGALHAFRQFRDRLAAEFDAQPSPETLALVQHITARAGRSAPALSVEGGSAAAPPAYEIVRQLGRGGMAVVHLARDVRHGRFVALKMLRPELAASIGQAQFLREIQLTARLAHPHVLPLLDSGMLGDELFYVTPFVEGESLRARIQSSGRLPVDEALRLGAEVAEALDYAHRLGIVHRDIKPENILLADGHAVVADFGIAAAITASVTSREGLAAVGSPAYMSPEQARGDGSIDPRSDLYSLGCVLYEMLAGEPPFRASTAFGLLEAQVSRPATSLLQHRPDVPLDVAAAIMRCLEKSPDDRAPTAAVVIQALTPRTRIDAGATVRRTLARTMTMYAVVAAAAVAAAAISLDRLSLPDWVLPGTILLVAAGVPAILLSEWVHYLTLRGLPASDTVIGRASRRISPYTRRAVPAGAVLAGASFVLGISGYMGMRHFGIGPAASLLSSGSLQPNQRILVADFEGPPADSLSLPALTAALHVGLAESRVYRLMTPDGVAATLERMRRPRTTPLTVDVAREVALREQVPIVLAPRVSRVGTGYVVSLRLVATDSGNTLGVTQEVARHPGELLAVMDKSTRRIRARIGESFREVRALPMLHQVTTHSLDALDLYGRAMRANAVEGDSRKAVTLLKNAVEIDSTFGMAWRALAAVLGNAYGPSTERDSALAIAYRLRHRTTPHERVAAEAYYYWLIQRDWAKAQAAYELLLDMGDTAGVVNLGELYLGQREFDRAEHLYRLIIAAEDTSRALPLLNLVEILFNLGKTAEAEEALRVARQRFPDNGLGKIMAQTMLYVRGDLHGLNDLLQRASRKDPGYRRDLRRQLALLRGRLSEYGELAIPGASGVSGPTVRMSLGEAATLATYDVRVRRDPKSAVMRLDRALKGQPFASFPDPNRRPYVPVATAYAIAGRPDRARDVLRQVEQAVTDTMVLRSMRVSLDAVRGEIALAEGRIEDAVAFFRAADIREGKPVQCVGCLSRRLADAYDRAGNADSTLAALERYVNTPWWARLSSDVTNLGRSYERLGQLHDGRGDTRSAIRYYGKLVELWKDADPDIQPRVRAARQRLLELRGR